MGAGSSMSEDQSGISICYYLPINTFLIFIIEIPHEAGVI